MLKGNEGLLGSSFEVVSNFSFGNPGSETAKSFFSFGKFMVMVGLSSTSSKFLHSGQVFLLFNHNSKLPSEKFVRILSQLLDHPSNL